MFSIIYTPTEGDAIQNYSRLFRRPEGCFLNINDVERVHDDLAQWGRPGDIDYIVVTGMSILALCAASKIHLLNLHQTERKSWGLVTRAVVAFSSRWPSSSSPHCVLASIPTGLSQWSWIVVQTTKTF